MTDIKVPHEYLDTLQYIRAYTVMGQGERAEVLDALIAAAEADQPPLPDGWYLIDGTRAYWQSGGRLYSTKNRLADCGSVEEERDRLTPLRPAVTEADVEKAAQAALTAYFDGMDEWDELYSDVRVEWMKSVRAALDALGIEVSG